MFSAGVVDSFRGVPVLLPAAKLVGVTLLERTALMVLCRRGRLKPQQRLSPLQPLSLSALYGSRQPLQACAMF